MVFEMVEVELPQPGGERREGGRVPDGFLGSRPLGTSGIEVSALSLGSWRTFERLPADTGVAIMRTARAEGINFFDDARYDDETGTAGFPLVSWRHRL
jgi:hypothetical protein